ncbi:MAG TPA: response regulator [Bacteroidetes bacterium]|nr:response regulator [Bacteroidota bacterium]
MCPNKVAKILIVDDEPDVVAYLAAFLEDNGFKAVSALNGREGFEKAKAEKPDLISLDITMPEESGLRMYQNLQEAAATRAIPVVIVTGTPGKFDRILDERMHVTSPAACFEKPIDREAFINKIREVLENRP